MTDEVVTPAWRNPKYNAVGTIDMEIDHPTYGWIPFTADPDDVEPLGKALYDAAIEFGEVVDCSPPSAEAVQNMIVVEVQARLDAFAKTRGYDGILSASTYAASAVPQFASEGQRAISLRDQTWQVLYQILADVKAGNRPVPSSFSQIEKDLPDLAWS
jgi:hypothetical protein